MKRLKSGTFALIAFLLALLGSVWLYLSPGSPAGSAEAAEAYYRQGVASATVAEQGQAFNAALAEFLRLEAEGAPRFGTGKLYFDIGNTYFQLGEYPRAILYYVRAKTSMPGSEEVEHNLALARKKLSIGDEEPSARLRWLLLDYWLPLPRRIQLFALFAVATTVFASLVLWQRKKWQARCAVLFSTVSAALLLNLAATYYLSPVEAVLVEAAIPRRNAGASFAPASEQPLPAGIMVEALEMSEDGEWVKIAAPGGIFGFLPAKTLIVR